MDQPLMQNVLADLCLESEAATALMMRLGRAYDSAQNPQERRFARIATAVSKYWVTKRATPMVAEALECLGGGGYVEESGMPRLLRESPLNSSWEGSGNVICLDVLRALTREEGTADAFLAELRLAQGADRQLDRATAELEALLRDTGRLELSARRAVERMALLLQASLLVRHGSAAVADAFCRSRLAGDRGLAFGTLPPDVDFRSILRRAHPLAVGG